MLDKSVTKEPQYEVLFAAKEKHGISSFGLMVNESWNNDPRRTLFTLSRYKFVSKILAGKKKVLEVGCADAFGTRLVQQTVGEVVAIDYDEVFINDVKSRYSEHWPMRSAVHDILRAPFSEGGFDAAFALDVLEHIPQASEDAFIRNISASLLDGGVLVIGMPSLESQSYASPQSKVGHVNCKTGQDLKACMERKFRNVFMFSMNDELVHTGFFPMAHYLFAVCVGPIRI